MIIINSVLKNFMLGFKNIIKNIEVLDAVPDSDVDIEASFFRR